MSVLNEELNPDKLQLNEILDKINTYPPQKLLSLIQRSIFQIYLKDKDVMKTKNNFSDLIKQYLALMSKHSATLTYSDAIANIRLIRTAEMEKGQKKLVQKLNSIIMQTFESQLSDPVRNIERVKEIFKVPCSELQKELMDKVIDNFGVFDSIFHVQLLTTLIRELKIFDQSKLNKEQKALEGHVIKYMDKFMFQTEIIDKILQSSKEIRIKILALLTKHQSLDYGCPDIFSEEMKKSHAQQRIIIHQIQDTLIDDIKYERVLHNKITELLSIKFFVTTSRLEGIKFNEKLNELLEKSMQQMTLEDWKKLTPNQIDKAVNTNSLIDEKLRNDLQQIGIDLLIQCKEENLLPLSYQAYRKLVIWQKNQSIPTQNDLKIRQILKEMFMKHKKSLQTHQKVDISNLIILSLKQTDTKPDYKFIETLFTYLMKDNLSLYFLKCEDIVYVLELISSLRFVRSHKDFWLRTEDYIMRMKQQLKVPDLVKLQEIYLVQTKLGSQVFMQEIESILMKQSSDFRKYDKQYLIRAIMNYNIRNQHGTTFSKVFSSLYCEIQHEMNYSEHLQMISCFADMSVLMSQSLYQTFAKEHLPKRHEVAKIDIQKYKTSDLIHLLNILNKYNGHTVHEDYFALIIKTLSSRFNQALVTQKDNEDVDILLLQPHYMNIQDSKTLYYLNKSLKGFHDVHLRQQAWNYTREALINQKLDEDNFYTQTLRDIMKVSRRHD
eukprot:403341811